MGVVIAGLVIVVIALGAAAVILMRRRDGGDVHSVEHYRHTLDTLGGVRTRVGADAGRVSSPAAAGPAAVPPEGTPDPGVLGPDEAESAATAASSATTVASAPPGEARRAIPVADWRTSAGNGARGSAVRPGNGNGNGTGLVFEDLSQPAQASGRAGRRRDRAMSAMNHRPRRVAAPVLATVIVLAVLAAVIAVGARNQSNPHHGRVAPPAAGHSAPTQAASTGHSGHATGGKSSKGSHTTTSTVPTSFKPVTASATTASYAPPSPAYTLVFTTGTGDCWVQVTTGGNVVLSRTMLAGQQQPVPVNGSTTVILGAPAAMSITLDQEPVILPSTYQTPFTLTFTPSG